MKSLRVCWFVFRIRYEGCPVIGVAVIARAWSLSVLLGVVAIELEVTR